MSEFYDSTEDLEAQVCDVYDESRPRWYSSLRDKPEDTKPAWSLARKKDSPSVRTYAEGGSLATARQRPREPCAKRQSVKSYFLLQSKTKNYYSINRFRHKIECYTIYILRPNNLTNIDM